MNIAIEWFDACIFAVIQTFAILRKLLFMESDASVTEIVQCFFVHIHVK